MGVRRDRKYMRETWTGGSHSCDAIASIVLIVSDPARIAFLAASSITSAYWLRELSV